MTVIPQCFRCRRLAGRPGLACDAFPGPAGIPAAILLNEHDHRRPYPGDRGIGFEPRHPDTRPEKGP
jgi:hypothetical protein